MSYDDMAGKRDVVALNNLNKGMKLLDDARLLSLQSSRDDWDAWFALHHAAFWERIQLRKRVAAWTAPWFEVTA